MGACGKKKFKRKIDVKLILAFKNDRRLERRFYWCKICKSYHLTKQEKHGTRTGYDSMATRPTGKEDN